MGVIMKRRNVYRILFIISFICLMLDVRLVYNHSLYNNAIKMDKIVKPSVINNKTESTKSNTLIGTNDIVGILSIENSDYSTYVTQYKDNNFYLNHDIYRNYNGNGTPFLDYRVNLDDSKKILIYGHNSSRYDMPFKILENYYDKNYYDNHRYIDIKSKDRISKYEIFSVYVETNNFDYIDLNYTSDEWQNHINSLKDASMYDTGVDVNSDDDILILQTCSTLPQYRKLKHKFTLVIAKKISSDSIKLD